MNMSRDVIALSLSLSPPLSLLSFWIMCAPLDSSQSVRCGALILTLSSVEF